MSNRIEIAIARISEKLNTISETEQRKLKQVLKVKLEDLVEYQKLQSTALACGKLPSEEAQTLYRIYGGEVPSPDRFASLSLAEKIVGIIVGQCLEQAIKGSGGDIQPLLYLLRGQVRAVATFLPHYKGA